MNAVDRVIIVENLSTHYGDLKAVDNVSLEVERGEIFGVLGPNGAGKTTLLETMEGLLDQTSGSVSVLGFDPRKNANDVKERIGIQLQASSYFDYLTVSEILELFSLFYTNGIDGNSLLSKVDLTDKANTTVKKLSGGQQQRFTIAASLLNDPEIVFLDEPTTGLDPQARRSLWDFVRDIKSEGRTVVLTTHYMEEAELLCDRVAIMDGGHIVALDSPENLARQLPVPYDIKVRTEGHIEHGQLKSLDAVVDVERYDDGAIKLRSTDASATLPSVTGWATSSGARLTHLEVIPATLEDVFLSLTGHGLGDES